MVHRIEARYRRDNAKNPAVLGTPEDVDALIDALLESPEDGNLAQLHSLERSLLPSGYPDHELLVGVNGDLQVGVLAFMDYEGNVVTRGMASRPDVAYSITGARTEFPDNSEIPVDLVRRAVKEFLLAGGQRPTCVPWQPDTW
jgi:hypothetical protein